MRQLKYLLDGFSRRLQDFYLQYSRVDLQVVKQTNSLWIFFFWSFIPSVHRSRTKSHGGLFFSVGTADFTVISTSNTQTASGFKRWIKKSCFFFEREREFTGEPGTSNKEKRVNKRSPGRRRSVLEKIYPSIQPTRSMPKSPECELSAAAKPIVRPHWSVLNRPARKSRKEERDGWRRRERFRSQGCSQSSEASWKRKFRGYFSEWFHVDRVEKIEEIMLKNLTFLKAH